MKIKRIIEIEEYHIKELQEYCKGEHYGQLRFEIISSAFSSIAQSKPYDDSGDLTSRSALKLELEAYRHTRNYKSDEDEAQNSLLDNILETVDNAPTVEPRIEYGTDGQPYKLSMTNGKEHERPKGEWIIVKDEKYGDNVKCPFCGKELAGTDLNFCCKCGADMRKGAAQNE